MLKIDVEGHDYEVYNLPTVKLYDFNTAIPFDECWVEGFDELYGRHCEAVRITTAD